MHALDRLIERLHVVRHRGSIIDARCPAHDDHHASLTASEGEGGRALVHCHAGCQPEEILTALGLSWADLSPEPHVVAVYGYFDEAGRHLWDVERWEPKDFRCRPGLPSKAERRLYHSEWLHQARAEARTIYICEGEKDCDTLAKLGEIAVCGVGGAGSWLGHYAEQLRDLHVVVIADADDPGRAHAREITRSLDGIAASVALTEPSYGKDVSDMVAAGYPLDTLVPLSIEETLGVYRADRVRERQLSWLWPGYLPAGKLTIIEGDPGDGKSVMTVDIAARLSTGAALPDGSRAPTGPSDVVMISAEDDPEDTIVPRLRVAGADLRRVHLVAEGSVPGSPFDLRRDLAALEMLINDTTARLVVIDPLMAFMPQDVDSYRDSDVRRAIHPLTRMAARTGCALLVVRHLTKGRSRAITAGGGSIAFIGAARFGYLVGHHPEDPHKRVLSAVKANIAELPASLAYRITPARTGEDLPVVTWDSAPLALTAQELLDATTDSEEVREEREAAREWLIEHLSINHSGAIWQDIVRAAKREGHDERTLRRIRRGLAEPRINPPDHAGTLRRGTFWFLLKVDERADRHLSLVPDPAPEPEPADPAPLPEFRPPLGPGPCQVCGSEPAVVFRHLGVRRCLAHHPETYGGDC